MKRKNGYLLYIGDGVLPSFVGIMINRYNEPYEPISIMECHVRVLNVAHLDFFLLLMTDYSTFPPWDYQFFITGKGRSTAMD